MTWTSQGAGAPYASWMQSGSFEKKICFMCMKFQFRQLKHESYGVELLHTIGFVYVSKARYVLNVTSLMSLH